MSLLHSVWVLLSKRTSGKGSDNAKRCRQSPVNQSYELVDESYESKMKYMQGGSIDTIPCHSSIGNCISGWDAYMPASGGLGQSPPFHPLLS